MTKTITYRCDSCAREFPGDYCTDTSVCGDGDGPGFFLCSETSCSVQRSWLTANELRRNYERGRAAGERIDAILTELDRKRFGEE
jgi:hypothetical protein